MDPGCRLTSTCPLKTAMVYQRVSQCKVCFLIALHFPILDGDWRTEEQPCYPSTVGVIEKVLTGGPLNQGWDETLGFSHVRFNYT